MDEASTENKGIWSLQSIYIRPVIIAATHIAPVQLKTGGATCKLYCATAGSQSCGIWYLDENELATLTHTWCRFGYMSRNTQLYDWELYNNRRCEIWIWIISTALYSFLWIPVRVVLITAVSPPESLQVSTRQIRSKTSVISSQRASSSFFLSFFLFFTVSFQSRKKFLSPCVKPWNCVSHTCSRVLTFTVISINFIVLQVALVMQPTKVIRCILSYYG